MRASQPATFPSSLDTAAKTVALLAFSTYVCGFLVSALYQSSFGFVDTSPLKPQALTAGAYFMASLIFPVVMAAYMIRAVSDEGRKIKWGRLLTSTLFFYVACQLIGIMFLALFTGFSQFDDALPWAFLMTFWLVGARKLVSRIPPGFLIVSSAAGILFLLVRSAFLIHAHRSEGGIEFW